MKSITFVLKNNMEIWKDIEGFRELYQVSNLGRIRRKDNHKVLKPLILTKGYKGVRLYYTKKDAVTKKIHRLVAKYFIGNPLNLPQVNHKDGNKNNNKAINLEWCSNEYNMNHAITNDLIKLGEDRTSSKCTEDSLQYIQKLIDCKFTIKQLSIVYCISKNSMKDIIRNKSYTHLHLNIKYNNPTEKRFNHKIIDKDLYNKLNNSLKDNTVLNTLIKEGYISVQCNA